MGADPRQSSGARPSCSVTPAEITSFLAGRGRWTYSRAGGPGGQRRDHAATRAQLEILAADLEGLPAPLAERLSAGLGLSARPLRLRSGTERLREQNRARVLARLEARVRTALAPLPPPRRTTRPTAASVERRLAAKRHRAAAKATRRPPEETPRASTGSGG